MEAAWLFGVVAIALALAALAFVLPPLLRRRPSEASRDEIDAEVFQREIDELQHDATLGEIPPEEIAAGRERARARLLAARERIAEAPNASRRARTAALIIAVTLPLIALAVYFAVGRPDSLASPEPQKPAPAGDYVARLQSHLARQPRDSRGWVLLARAHSERNDFVAAVAAYEKAIATSPRVAKDPGVLCEYADALGMSQGGRLDGKPTELITEALAIDPKHPVALEMAGSAAYADGRYAEAVRYWQALLAQVPEGTPERGELNAAIARAQRRAAVSLPR